jgi:hypothetical protein
MKNAILKLLWLDDGTIRKRGDVIGKFGIIAGLLLIAAVPFLYLRMNNTSGEVSARTDSLIQQIESSGPELSDRVLKDTVWLLRSHTKFVHKLSFPIIISVFGIGLAVITAGVLYIKLNRSMKNDKLTGHQQN